MTLTERAAESVARGFDRRRFLQRAAGAVFGFAATTAVTGIRAPGALADGPCPNSGESCGCNFPWGLCTNCQGSTCPVGCSGVFSPHSGNGCWCSKRCCYNCAQTRNYCGYYVCCDCSCSGSNCGCRSFFTTCDNIDGGPPCC